MHKSGPRLSPRRSLLKALQLLRNFSLLSKPGRSLRATAAAAPGGVVLDLSSGCLARADGHCKAGPHYQSKQELTTAVRRPLRPSGFHRKARREARSCGSGAAIELETQPTATRLSKMIRSQRDSSDARHDARHGSKAFCAAKEESRRPTWNRSDHSDRGDFRHRMLVLAGVGPRKSVQTHCIRWQRLDGSTGT